MKKQIIHIYSIFLIIGLLFFASCKLPSGAWMEFKNNSTQSIRYLSPLCCDGSLFVNNDTTLKLCINPPNTYHEIPSNKTRLCAELHSYPFEYIYTNLQVDVLPFFIFSSKVLDSLPWDTIRNQYLILQRYDLSVFDADHIGTLVFPPDSTMKHIHMWPPYGTYDQRGGNKKLKP